MDTASMCHCALASTSMRRAVSASVPVVVAMLDADSAFGLDSTPLSLLMAAVDLTCASPLPTTCGAEGWVLPWREGLGLPRCLDWSVTPWCLACSSLPRLASLTQELQAQLGLPTQDLADLSDR